MTTLQDDGIYEMKDVAELVLGHPVRWFRRHRKQLEAEEGFPPPISRIGRPRWSGRTLIAWLNRPQTPTSETTPTKPEPTLTDQHYLDIIRARIAKKREERERKAAK